ncbi:hypothetical protein AB6D11_06510 [Vibrio splendidus]
MDIILMEEGQNFLYILIRHNPTIQDAVAKRTCKWTPSAILDVLHDSGNPDIDTSDNQLMDEITRFFNQPHNWY